MGERLGGGASWGAGGGRAWTRLLCTLVVLAVLGLAIAGAQARVSAQTAAPTVEESPDEATILLLPYLLADADALNGYSLTSMAAHPLEVDAFDAVMVPPADPRPMDTLLTRPAQDGHRPPRRGLRQPAAARQLASSPGSAAILAAPVGDLSRPILLTQSSG